MRIKSLNNPISEDHLQMLIIKWSAFHPICRDYLIHVPNGGRRDIREAAKFKRMGVKAGVPDLVLLYPSGGYHGLFMELKVGKNRLSDAQKGWFEKLERVKYKCILVKSLAECTKCIDEYLEMGR